MDVHYLLRMSTILETEANLTAQNQITIPASIRKVLGLRGGESRVKFQVIDGGKVQVVRVDPLPPDDEDPVLKPFLHFLSKDMMQHPERITAFPPELLDRARAIAGDIDVDLDAPLTGED